MQPHKLYIPWPEHALTTQTGVNILDKDALQLVAVKWPLIYILICSTLLMVYGSSWGWFFFLRQQARYPYTFCKINLITAETLFKTRHRQRQRSRAHSPAASSSSCFLLLYQSYETQVQPPTLTFTPIWPQRYHRTWKATQTQQGVSVPDLIPNSAVPTIKEPPYPSLPRARVQTTAFATREISELKCLESST